MKKLNNEKELVKKAIAEGVKYGEKRGVVEFEATDSADEKILYIYRLLVHDKVIQPLPEDQVSQKSMSINWLSGRQKARWLCSSSVRGLVGKQGGFLSL